MTTHDDPNDPVTHYYKETSPGRVEFKTRPAGITMNAPFGRLKDPSAVAEYVRSRYGGLTTPKADPAGLSHVQWLAEKVRTIATDLLTEAQLREEETIENLVSAKNACDETVAPAQAVLAAAESVEELERNIEWLTKLIDDPHPGAHVWTAAPADDEDDAPPAGDCDA